jgi:hypothetical protein
LPRPGTRNTILHNVVGRLVVSVGRFGKVLMT